jgi:tRNA modification GTPase
LLEEERAIVSDIPGTTRDTIEDEIVIAGIRFRFIDTAGIRHSSDAIEILGISRTYSAIQQATIVIYVFDVYEINSEELDEQLATISPYLTTQKLILTGNKIDKFKNHSFERKFPNKEIVFISAKEKSNIEKLKKKLIEYFTAQKVQLPDVVVTNARHLDCLQKTSEALDRTKEGLEKKLSGELLASDIRQALYHLGLITGEITTDDLLENIFSRFCIGK